MTGTSGPVAVTVKPGELQPYYIHADQIDTPRVITDTAENVVWQWDNQDPFGNNVPNENPSNQGVFKFNQRFPGQYYDKETNLAYNVNRDYDPSIGRYVQFDPIGLAAGVNGFVYVLDNPLSYVDPFGLYHCVPGANCDFTPPMQNALQCFDRCTGRDNEITSGRRSGGGQHGSGQACDLNRANNPDLSRDNAAQCTQQCFPHGYGQEERNGPNSSAPNGTHFHEQLNTVPGGIPRFNPDIRPYQPSPSRQ